MGGSYQVPAYSGDGTNMVMTFANQEMVLVEDTPIVLRIYAGTSGGVPQWQNVTIQAASGQTLWQNWNLSYDAGTGTYAASAVSGSSQPVGSLLVNNLPKPENGTAWYQIVVGTGDAAKTYNLYANVTNGELENPAYAGQEGSLAIDGLALATPSVSTAQTISTFSLSFLYGGSTSLDPALLEQNTASTYVSGRAVPFAPVAGTLSGSTFTAEPDQDNPTTNSITVSEGALAFGWTGTNSASGTSSWISGYTNKVGALNWGVMSLVEVGGGTTFAPLGTQADIDGQWTSAAATLGNGTYTVTMTEYAEADTGFTTALGPQSSALTLQVSLSDLQIQATAGHALTLVDDASATAGNWLRFDVQASSLPRSTSVLLYAVNGQGDLVARDGATGAGVTLEDAVIGTLGASVSDTGATLFNGAQMVYLGLGQELRFALQTGASSVDLSPAFSATATGTGSVALNVGGVQLSAMVDNTLLRRGGTGRPTARLQRGADLSHPRRHPGCGGERQLRQHQPARLRQDRREPVYRRLERRRRRLWRHRAIPRRRARQPRCRLFRPAWRRHLPGGIVLDGLRQRRLLRPGPDHPVRRGVPARHGQCGRPGIHPHLRREHVRLRGPQRRAGLGLRL